MEKHLLLKVSGRGGKPEEISIRPGVTTKDVLEQANISTNFFLTADPDGEPFGPDEVLWDKVEDGAKLFAVAPMKVGR